MTGHAPQVDGNATGHASDGGFRISYIAVPALSWLVILLVASAATFAARDLVDDERELYLHRIAAGLSDAARSAGVNADVLAQRLTRFEGITVARGQGDSGDLVVRLDRGLTPEMFAVPFALSLLGFALGALASIRMRRRDLLALAARRELVGRITDMDEELDDPPTQGGLFGPLDRSARRLRRMIERRVQADERTSTSGRMEQAKVFASMSHDLKSPLNSIIGFTDLLTRGIEGDLNGEQDRTVREIAEQAERLLVLVGDILDTSKIDAGRFELDRAWVPLVDILRDLETGVRRLAVAGGVALDVRMDPGIPPLKVDKERMGRALLSLAIRLVAEMETGAAALTASRRGLEAKNTLALRLHDPEGRISPERRAVLAEILDAGERAFSAGAPADTALGFSLSRKIVEMHGGTVRVVTEEGDDALLEILLPLDDGDGEG